MVENQFSKQRPSRPMLSISRNVRLCVRLSVCLSVCSLLRYRLTVFLPPLPKVGCTIFLEIQNHWGKSNGKKWSNMWTFLFGSGLKSFTVFLCWFCLGPPSYGIGATIRIGQEMLCLPYAGFFMLLWLKKQLLKLICWPGQGRTDAISQTDAMCLPHHTYRLSDYQDNVGVFMV